MPRFRVDLSAEASSSDDDSNSKNDDLEYSDDDDDEEEPPHPLGFIGRCRYTLKDDDDMLQRENYDFTSPERLNPQKQSFPPLSDYVNPRTVSTQELIRSSSRRLSSSQGTHNEEDSIEQITRFLREAIVSAPSSSIAMLPSSSSVSLRDVTEPYRNMQTDHAQIQRQIETQRRQFALENDQAARSLQAILHRNEQRYQQANKLRLLREQQEQERIEKEAAEQEKKDADEQQEAEALEEEERNRNAKAAARAQEKEAQEQARQEAQAAAAAKERDYIARAHKLVDQLVQLRASVEPFEKSTAQNVKVRRLQMKKLVGGKINTLTESADKVRSVAADVAQAIATARAEDEQIKQMLAAGNPQVTPEMARGKRYLVDLLSSKVIVRVQAEGFNGPRGDGFPLANLCCLAAADNKDLIPVLSAHIYTVCPTAIPSLPTVAQNATEEELMESLGMLRQKDGSFETFERFLTRTESIISLVADIFSSMPSSHLLLGGHEAAIKWLSRFLDLLPSAPSSPLPLVTAPVLDAFLTGAGHMLANIHQEEFQTHLDVIANDIVKRLDVGAVGAPSATRLKKTVAGGIAHFKNTLPSRALPELYYGSIRGGSASSGAPSHSSSFGATTTSSSNPFQASNTSSLPSNNPFGQSTSSSSTSPFGPSTASTSPFGPSTSATTPSTGTSFGAPAPGPVPSPFSASPPQQSPFTSSSGPDASTGTAMDSSSAMDTMSPAPFGFSGTSSAPSAGFQSAFGQPSAPAPSPFGAGLSNSLGFGSAPIGNAPVPSSFSQQSAGGFGLAPSPSPFGTSAPAPVGLFGAPANSPSPFGAPTFSSIPFGAQTTSSSPFGNPAPAPTPFGSAPSPFGAPIPAPSPSPFGGPMPAPSPSPFGGPSIAPNPSPFGAPMSAPSPFGGAVPSLFGAPAQSSAFGGSLTFGKSSQSTGFGASAAPNPSPFSAPGSTGFSQSSASAAPFSSPFGAAPAPQSTPFGASSSFVQQQANGLVGNPQSSSTPFGQQQQPGGGFGSSTQGGNNRPPCKFFAEGRCRFGDQCRFSHDARF